MTTPVRWCRAVVWVGGLAAGLVVLRLAGAGLLAPPPVGSLDQLTQWAEARDATTGAVALVRLAAELAVWYLLGLSLLRGVAHVGSSRGAGSLADALSVAGTDRLVRAGLGLGLVATTAIGTRGEQPAEPPATATMQPVAGPRGTATMVPRTSAPPAEAPIPEVPVTASPIATPAPLPRPTISTPTWTIERGESLWTVAAEHLAASTGRTPTDAQVTPYWALLVETNRHRLADPGDPDLVFAGQVVELPPVAVS